MHIFYIDNNNCQLVAKNESVVDGGYGTWTNFEPIFKNDRLISFSSKVVQVDSDESKTYNENDEDLIISYSDSIIYTQKSSRWVGNIIAQKEKVYRKESTTFNEFYKNNN